MQVVALGILAAGCSTTKPAGLAPENQSTSKAAIIPVPAPPPITTGTSRNNTEEFVDASGNLKPDLLAYARDVSNTPDVPLQQVDAILRDAQNNPTVPRLVPTSHTHHRPSLTPYPHPLVRPETTLKNVAMPPGTSSPICWPMRATYRTRATYRCNRSMPFFATLNTTPPSPGWSPPGIPISAAVGSPTANVLSNPYGLKRECVSGPNKNRFWTRSPPNTACPNPLSLPLSAWKPFMDARQETSEPLMRWPRWVFATPTRTGPDRKRVV